MTAYSQTSRTSTIPLVSLCNRKQRLQYIYEFTAKGFPTDKGLEHERIDFRTRTGKIPETGTKIETLIEKKKMKTGT